MMDSKMKELVLEHENELNKIRNDKNFYEQKCKDNFKDSIINFKNNSIM